MLSKQGSTRSGIDSVFNQNTTSGSKKFNSEDSLMENDKKEIDLIWLQEGIAISALVFISVFVVVFLPNIEFIKSFHLPAGDYASDALLMQQAEHHRLLTGHYSHKNYVNHPGPYFLYVRFLAGKLAAGFAGSVFGAQLLGTFANNALFAGLFSGLFYSLCRRNGASKWAAFCVVAIVVSMVAAQPSSLNYLTINGESTYGASIADPWMPEALIWPFLSFLAASITLMEGAAAPLVIGTFSGAALVHGYIPMPAIVGPVWLAAVFLGLRARRARGIGGFPRTAWLIAAAIVAVFSLPMVADAIINPPGNIAAIVTRAMEIRESGKGAGWTDVALFLQGQWRGLFVERWIILFVGGMAAVFTFRHGLLWRRTLVVLALTGIASLLAYHGAPLPLHPYQGKFFLSLLFILAAAGVFTLVMEMERRHKAFPILLLMGMLMLTGYRTSLAAPKARSPHAHQIATTIAAGVPAGRIIAIDPVNMTGMPPTIIAALFIELEHRGIFGCSRLAEDAYIYSKERICSPDAAPYRFYRIGSVTPCPADALLRPPQRPGDESLITRTKAGICIRLMWVE